MDFKLKSIENNLLGHGQQYLQPALQLIKKYIELCQNMPRTDEDQVLVIRRLEKKSKTKKIKKRDIVKIKQPKIITFQGLFMVPVLLDSIQIDDEITIEMDRRYDANEVFWFFRLQEVPMIRSHDNLYWVRFGDGVAEEFLAETQEYCEKLRECGEQYIAKIF